MCFLVLILAVRLLISCVTYPHSAAGRVYCKYEVLRRLVLDVDATARRIGTVMRAGSLSVLLLVLILVLVLMLRAATCLQLGRSAWVQVYFQNERYGRTPCFWGASLFIRGGTTESKRNKGG